MTFDGLEARHSFAAEAAPQVAGRTALPVLHQGLLAVPSATMTTSKVRFFVAGLATTTTFMT